MNKGRLRAECDVSLHLFLMIQRNKEQESTSEEANGDSEGSQQMQREHKGQTHRVEPSGEEIEKTQTESKFHENITISEIQ